GDDCYQVWGVRVSIPEITELTYFEIMTSVALITAETESPLLRFSSSALSRVIMDSTVPASTDIVICATISPSLTSTILPFKWFRALMAMLVSPVVVGLEHKSTRCCSYLKAPPRPIYPRITMTSVDFIRANARTPFLSARASQASLVIIDVTYWPPTSIVT